MIVDLSDEERAALEYLAERRNESVRKALRRVIRTACELARSADTGYPRRGLMSYEECRKFWQECNKPDDG